MDSSETGERRVAETTRGQQFSSVPDVMKLSGKPSDGNKHYLRELTDNATAAFELTKHRPARGVARVC
jgi:hypothetical protein